MHDLLNKVRATIADRSLLEEGSPVLLMVSGGSDSTALAYLTRELVDAGELESVALVHINHQLRGEAAEADAAFVEELAALLEIPFFLAEVDVAGEAARSGENVEAVGRRERYAAARDALRSLCMHVAAPTASGRIFTAHTQDDRVENFYMRSIVGTGPGGFRSMLYRNGPVVRPLLDVSRSDLRSYLQERADAGLPVVRDAEGNLWREDATNAHTDRFRAFVRHEIVPLAMDRNPQLLSTLCRSMNLIGDEDDMLDVWSREVVSRCVKWEDINGDDVVDYEAGCLLLPEFGSEPVPLQRRAAFEVLQLILGGEARVETAAVDAIVAAFTEQRPIGGYTKNIQGDLALSANKQGLRIEPMSAYRTRRKRN